MPSIPEVITHYQRSIEKSGKDQERLLHCLEKLYKLNVSVQHLQDTGVGRTVNTLRKNSGEVGVAAKTLVAKWKQMVTAHESESGNSSMDEDDYLDRIDPSSSASHETSPEKAQHSKSGSSSATADGQHNSSSSSSHRHQHSSSSSSNKHASPSKSASSHKETQNGSKTLSNNLARSEKSSGHHSHRSTNDKSSATSHHKSSRSSAPAENSSAAKSVAVSGSSSTSRLGNSPADKMPATSSSSSSSGKRRAEEPSSSSSGTSKERKERKIGTSSSSSSSHEKKKSKTVQEIDSSMGTSFADALGMMTPGKKGGISVKSKPGTTAAAPSTSSAGSSRHVSSTESPQPSTSRSQSSSAERKPVAKPVVYNKPNGPPSLLTSAAKLAPLDPEIAVAISNDYRPMPLNPIIMDFVLKGNQPAAAVPKQMSDAELGASMSSKNMRTKVYSGVKTGALHNVPSLHEICIRVLQRNIEALEATGGVPFEILKPVLERATPDQLFTLEDYNPYLIDDTGDLWLQHCNRKFRGQKPREYESWRDMFLRCREEQELRLSHLTENIKRTQTVAVPVKQTKITFVDSAVKPPRDVLKKQARFGTERVPVCTPAARVASLNNSTSNIARPGDARLRVVAGMRDHAQVNARVQRKAPLMQKTLQHMKGLFKR